MGGKAKTAQKLPKSAQDNRRVFYGEKVRLLNLSAQERFCAETGERLPRNGMVVRFQNNYYLNWNASERANNKKS